MSDWEAKGKTQEVAFLGDDTAAADAAPIATEGFQPKDPVNSLGEKTSAPEDNEHADP